MYRTATLVLCGLRNTCDFYETIEFVMHVTVVGQFWKLLFVAIFTTLTPCFIVLTRFHFDRIRIFSFLW